MRCFGRDVLAAETVLCVYMLCTDDRALDTIARGLGLSTSRLQDVLYDSQQVSLLMLECGSSSSGSFGD